MGGFKNSGGGQRTPHVAPVSLESAQRLKIVDLICEGVKDLAHPISAKDVFLDGTPLQNQDDSYNFDGVEIYGLPGTPDQDYLPGFETSDTVVSVGTEVKQSQPVTRTIIDPAVDRVRVTIGVGGLEEVTKEGDTVERSVDLTVTAVNGNRAVSKSITISGRTDGAYNRDVVLENLPPVPFNLTVSRITGDSTSNRIKDKTQWVSYVESIDAKLNYPDSVVVGIKIDSKLFGGRVPRRTYRSHWTIVDVPSNYDPDTRTYSGVWDGKFKRAWSNNPAWIYRDLVTNERYGLARFRDDITVDKWALYSIARYCDELVDDGNGGQEPRFVCNAYLTQPRDAYDVLSDLASCFRGITFFDGLQQVAVQDTPRDPVAIYSNSNVVDGIFEYAGVGYKDIVTACIVKFADENNSYQTDSVQYQDDDAVARFGYNVKSMTGFGVTSRGQAQRVARWYVETSLRERETVQFAVGREGIRHTPYDIIKIADNDYAGDQLGARIVSASGNKVTLDRDVNTDSVRMSYIDTSGKARYRAINNVNGAVLTLSSAPTGLSEHGVVAITQAELAPRLFRAMSITENDDGTYTVSAVSHDPQKEAVVDQGAHRHDDIAATRHGKPQVFASRVERDGRDLSLKWDAIASDAVSYEIKIYRDGELYKTLTSDTPNVDLRGLPLGDYRAEIRALDKNGGLSDAIEQAWSLNYDITSLKAKSQIMAIDLSWGVPANVINDAWIELYYSETDDVSTAQRLARLPYPSSQYTLSNVELSDVWYFWARMVDGEGNIGSWTQSVRGAPTTDPAILVNYLNGAIGIGELSQTLIAQLASNDAQAASNAMASEAAARAEALANEARERTSAIQQSAQQQTTALNQKAAELGNKITAVENVADGNTQKIETLTTATESATAAIETEKQARIQGDNAEVAAREALAARVGANESGITSEQQARIDADNALTRKTDTLTSRVGANESSITSLSETVVSNQSSTSTQINNLTSKLDSKIDGPVKTVVDLTGLDANLWYPVVTSPIPTTSTTAISIDVALKSGVHNVSWSSHSTRSFSLLAEWTTNGDAWGTVHVERNINKFTYSWVSDDKSPLIKIGQLTRSSREYCLLRGGAKYNIYTPVGVSVALHQNGLSALDQSIESSGYDADLVPQADLNAISADINSFKQTQAGIDAAQTEELNSAKSQINSNSASISNIQTTKAGKTEVASLARNALQSEWRADADAKAATVLSTARSEITNLRQTVSNNQQTTATQINNLSSRVDKKVDTPRTTTLDLTVLDNNAWFPVVTSPIPTTSTTAISIDVALKSGVHNVSWSSHSTRSFSLMCEWTTNGDAWGTVHVERNINKFTYSWVSDDKSPLIKIGQLTRSSREYCLLRGGAKYNVHTPVDISVELHAEGFSQSGQSIVPQNYDPALVPQTDLAKIGATLSDTQETLTTLDGKVSATRTIKAQVISGGRTAIAGISVGAGGDAASVESQVIVMADKFGVVKNAGDSTPKQIFSVANDNVCINGNLIANGTILGQHIRANQTINAPSINGGSLNIGGSQGSFVVSNNGSVSITTPGNAGLSITSDRIEVRDEQGNVRVRIGKLT